MESEVITGERSITLGDKDITAESSNSLKRWAYTFIRTIRLTKYEIFIIFADQSYFQLPLSAFHSVAQKDQFLTTLNTKAVYAKYEVTKE